MTQKRFATAAILALLISLLSFTSFAQTAGTSRVTGVVQDQANAVVPGASVTLTNEGTNGSFKATTTSAGFYAFDGIQLGSYSVTVEKQGFKKFVSKGNTLTLGQPLTINVDLTVGGTEEVVEVTASYERVQTSTSGNFGTTVDNKTLTDLPIGLDIGTGGRNPLRFVLLQPGVNSGANTGGGTHVNGARDRAINYTLDGIDINESSAGGADFAPLRTNPDGLQELRVITSNATAEWGRNSGAQVALVTKSGTNNFHGNLFYFNRNSAMSANEWGNNLNAVRKQFFLQNQWGGDVGGPISIPGLYSGKDRTFFFFDYQQQRQTRPFTLTRTVYTPQAKQGIFRWVAGGRNIAAGQTGASVDAAGNPTLPACGATVTTNCIASYNILANDPRRLGIDPASQRILNLLPAPNRYDAGDGLNTAGFLWSGGRLDPQKDFIFKIDHKFNDDHNMFVRYGWGKQNTVNDTGNGGAPGFPGLPPKVNTTRDPRNLAASHRWVITPSLSNEIVAGGNHFTFNFINPSAGLEPFSVVTVNPTDPLDFTVGNLRTINTYQFVDNLSWVKSAHLLKAGVNFRYQQHKDIRGSIAGQNANPIVNLGGTVNTACLSGAYGSAGTTGVNAQGQELFCLPNVAAGSALAINTLDRPRLQSTINDLLGRISSIRQGFVADIGLTGFQPGGSLFLNDARYGEYDFYLQDTWKIRPNLTADIGMRFEAKLTPFARGRLYGPNQPVKVGAPASDTLKWQDRNLYDSDNNNWSPSIGLAWDPWGDGKTSVRANYRLAYDRINTFVLSSQIYNTIPGVTFGLVNTDFGVNGGPNRTAGRLRDGLPAIAPTAGVSPLAQLQPAAFGQGAITVVDPDFRSPKTNQWQLDIQRDLGKNIVVNVAYIGRRAAGLFGAYRLGEVEFRNNGFLDEYNKLLGSAAYQSPLFNKLYAPDTRRVGAETGSDFVRRQFAGSIALNSVAAIAADAAGRVQSGRSLLELAGYPTSFFRPFPQFADITVIDSNDYSTYHALQMVVQRKFSSGLQFQGSYTFSKSLDTRSFDPAFTVAGGGSDQSGSSTPFDNQQRFLNYARSDFDRTHLFTGYAIWDMPFGKGGWFGSNAPGFARRFIEGWNVNGAITWESGRPFTIYTGASQFSNIINTPAVCNGCSRSMGKLDKNASNFAGVPGYFTAGEIAKFAQAPAGSLGNTGRNFFTGPGFFNIDTAVLKRTKITETSDFELRFEIFNILNHPNFGFPTAVLTSTVFGRIRDNTSSESRKIRIGAKINF